MRSRILAMLLLVATYTTAQPEVIDKVIALVGSELVLLSDVEEQFALAQSQQGGQLPSDARCNILDQVLSKNLLINQAKLDSVLVDDSEVETQLNARIDRILGLMGGDLKQFEDYYGQSVSEVKDAFREDLKGQLLSDRMQQQIVSGISVTPSEVKDFYAKIPSDSLPYFSSEVELGEVIWKPQVNEEEHKNALDKIIDLRKQVLEDSLDFAALAEVHSDDLGSGRQGGDLGWTTRGKFVPDFEAAAYNLEINEISEPVETQFGFHIIQLLGRRGNTIHTRHILIRPEITDADLELAKTKLDSVRQLIESDSLNFSLAVKRHSDKDGQSYNNDGRMQNQMTGNTFFEIGDLEPDIYFAIDTLQIGGTSEAFAFSTPTGETYYRVIQLQSRTNPHRASLAQDYSRIRQAAIDAKKNEYIGEWLRARIEATYIRIDSMFDSCPDMQQWKGK